MTAEFHKANRQRLYAEMKDGSAAVFFSGSAPRQSADAYYTFFTNRNFLYLTGIKFAGFVLVATKIGGNVQESIYILPPDLMKERWTGRRPKADEVMAQSGITDIRFVENFENDIHRVLNSGNVQHVVSITADCDADALVVEVVKSGPACHTGAESCFFNEVYVSPELKQFSWQGLYDLIKGRKTSPKEGSYTTYLFEKGKEKILKKVGEECTEVIIAGEKEDKAETVYEISDLAYHVLVLMVQAGITVEDITRELEKRHVIDHKVKQERMQ